MRALLHDLAVTATSVITLLAVAAAVIQALAA